jgi:hypothetical protein
MAGLAERNPPLQWPHHSPGSHGPRSFRGNTAFNSRPDKPLGVQNPWRAMRAKSNLLKRFNLI